MASRVARLRLLARAWESRADEMVRFERCVMSEYDKALSLLLMMAMAAIQDAEVSNITLLAAGQCDSEEYLLRMTNTRRSIVDSCFRRFPKAHCLMNATLPLLAEEEVSSIALMTSGRCEPVEHLQRMLVAKVEAVAAHFGLQQAARLRPDLAFLLDNGTE